MRIKNLRRSVRSYLKKLDSFTLKTSKKHVIRNFLCNGRVSVNISIERVYFKELKKFEPFLIKSIFWYTFRYIFLIFSWPLADVTSRSSCSECKEHNNGFSNILTVDLTRLEEFFWFSKNGGRTCSRFVVASTNRNFQ